MMLVDVLDSLCVPKSSLNKLTTMDKRERGGERREERERGRDRGEGEREREREREIERKGEKHKGKRSSMAQFQPTVDHILVATLFSGKLHAEI